MRGAAFAISGRGDPRFSLKRAFTIPKKARQAIMGVATNILGSVPVVGPLAKAVMQAHPGAFPNTPPSAYGGATTMPVLNLGSSPTMPSMGGVGPGGMFPRSTHVAGHRRRMNWANSRALGRAERRLSSFVKHFTRHAKHLGIHVGRAPRRAAPRRKR
jgi:hypothetical protein